MILYDIIWFVYAGLVENRTALRCQDHLYYDYLPLQGIPKRRHLSVCEIQGIFRDIVGGMVVCTVFPVSSSVLPLVVDIQQYQEEYSQGETSKDPFQSSLYVVSKTELNNKKSSLTVYFGASLSRNSWGPMIFPVQ